MRRYNPKYMVYQDLIGITLEAKSKTNLTWTDFRNIGTVLDDRKNILLVQGGANSKIYIKKNYIFQCQLPQKDGTKIIIQFDGEKIIGRPENRLKQIRKNRRKYH